MNSSADIQIPPAPMANLGKLRDEFSDVDVNLELQGIVWVYTAQGKNGADPWFVMSNSLTRFRNALLGKGFLED